jgi:hypothetical protein
LPPLITAVFPVAACARSTGAAFSAWVAWLPGFRHTSFPVSGRRAFAPPCFWQALNTNCTFNRSPRLLVLQPPQVTVLSAVQAPLFCLAPLAAVRSHKTACSVRCRTAGPFSGASVHRRFPPRFALRSAAAEWALVVLQPPSFLFLWAVPPCASLAPSLTRHRPRSPIFPSSRTLERPTRQSTGPARKAAQAGYFYVDAVEKPLFVGILEEEMARIDRAIFFSALSIRCGLNRIPSGESRRNHR